MKQMSLVGLAMLLVFALATPAIAEPPVRNVVTDVTASWELNNPCTESGDDLILEGWTVLREIHRDGLRTITTVQMGITGPEPWSGHGRDTGAELMTGETVSYKLMITNSDTGQKAKYFLRGHFNSHTGEWNPGYLYAERCVRS